MPDDNLRHLPKPAPEPKGTPVSLRIGNQRLTIRVQTEIAPATPEPAGKLVQMEPRRDPADDVEG